MKESMARRLGLVGGILIAAVAVWLTTKNHVVFGAETTGVITGTVSSAEKGPEAGVWVIAETDDLPTKFRKIVVTNDQGKFLLPEMPKANYKVWARGYGLLDSKAIMSTLGQDLKLTSVVAKDPRQVAQIYPASYWFSLLELPKESEFPGTGPTGNGINPQFKTRTEFVDNLKACVRCHQVGTKWTREIPEGEGDTTLAAWDHRTRRGQRGAEMSGFMSKFGRQRGLQMFASWSDRIAAGEVPPAPPRPQRMERNVVLTEWEWTDTMGKIHDEVSTDKRNPRLNANGPIYGTNIANDFLAVLDPATNSTKMLPIPARVDRSTMPASYSQTYDNPSRLTTLNRFNPVDPHNPMLDSQGRVWYTAHVRNAADQPAWCKEGSDNKYAQYFPLRRTGRNTGYYDPKTGKFTMIDTCFATHHLQFANDPDQTLYFGNPGGTVFGWLNTKMYDQTGDEKASQGWCPTVVDTNGDGKITKPWNEPKTHGGGNEEDTVTVTYDNFDPKLDTRVVVGAYGIIVSPLDGSVWGTSEAFPGSIIRFTMGKNPPETCVSEVFQVPSEPWALDMTSGGGGFRPRGIDVDKNGVIWTALSGSNHLASFDRSKCKMLGGPESYLGRQCKEGWSFYPMPAPTFKGTSYRSESNYYNWVDQFNTLGLGENIPIANGTGSDSLLALMPKTGQWVVMRVPYPIGGFHSRGMDGRIDDPKAGWKGRGVYASNGADTVWHAEDGLHIGKDGSITSASKPILVKFQIRPDPLAK